MSARRAKRSRAHREANPCLAVYCGCGVQWYGEYADPANNPAITLHAARCGEPVSLAQFEALGHTVRFPSSWSSRQREYLL